MKKLFIFSVVLFLLIILISFFFFISKSRVDDSVLTNVSYLTEDDVLFFNDDPEYVYTSELFNNKRGYDVGTGQILVPNSEKFAFCGNSVLEVGEDCDTIVDDSVSCKDFGFSGGRLSCGAPDTIIACMIVTDECYLDLESDEGIVYLEENDVGAETLLDLDNVSLTKAIIQEEIISNSELSLSDSNEPGCCCGNKTTVSNVSDCRSLGNSFSVIENYSPGSSEEYCQTFCEEFIDSEENKSVDDVITGGPSSSCVSGGTVNSYSVNRSANCGDGVVQVMGGEACEGKDMQGFTCTWFGIYSGGELGCYPKGHESQCQLDFSNCVERDYKSFSKYHGPVTEDYGVIYFKIGNVQASPGQVIRVPIYMYQNFGRTSIFVPLDRTCKRRNVTGLYGGYYDCVTFLGPRAERWYKTSGFTLDDVIDYEDEYVQQSEKSAFIVQKRYKEKYGVSPKLKVSASIPYLDDKTRVYYYLYDWPKICNEQFLRKKFGEFNDELLAECENFVLDMYSLRAYYTQDHFFYKKYNRDMISLGIDADLIGIGLGIKWDGHLADFVDLNTYDLRTLAAFFNAPINQGQASVPPPGRVWVAMATAYPIVGNQILLELQLKIKSDTPVGTVIPIDFTCKFRKQDPEYLYSFPEYPRREANKLIGGGEFRLDINEVYTSNMFGCNKTVIPGSITVVENPVDTSDFFDKDSDHDNDGFRLIEDCNDWDPSIHKNCLPLPTYD